MCQNFISLSATNYITPPVHDKSTYSGTVREGEGGGGGWGTQGGEGTGFLKVVCATQIWPVPVKLPWNTD